MQTAMNTETKTAERPGIVYRTVCQNPGCGATFDLRITPQNAGLLSGDDGVSAMPQAWWDAEATRRLGNKLFAAKLLYRATGVASSRADEEEPLFGEDQPY